MTRQKCDGRTNQRNKDSDNARDNALTSHHVEVLQESARLGEGFLCLLALMLRQLTTSRGVTTDEDQEEERQVEGSAANATPWEKQIE